MTDALDRVLPVTLTVCAAIPLLTIVAPQPRGVVTDPRHAAAGRLWGVGGLHRMARCEGLTKEEAHAIVYALNKLTEAPTDA